MQQQLGSTAPGLLAQPPPLFPGGIGARPKQSPQVAAAPAPAPAPVNIPSATHLYQAAVDPALMAYGQAYANPARGTATQASQAFATPPAQQVPCATAFSTPPTQPVPGVNPHVWMQQQQLLGAAAGLGTAATSRSASKEKEGKCLPEQYIEKSAINDPDVKAPSYYDFVHGIFRMLNEKVNEKNEPINDLLVYYEQITNYATQHRWSAVFSLHRSMCNEVELGMRNWSSEIKYRNASKHLNVASDLSELKRSHSVSSGGGAPPEKKVRHDKQRPRAASERPSNTFRGVANDDYCHLFNYQAKGCTYGFGRCNFKHECEKCGEKGVVVAHPAMFCPPKDCKSSGDSKQK